MTLSNDWETKRLSDVVEVQRGFDLPYQARRPGPYPVLTSGETGGFHDEGPIKGPGMTIGRATNLGRPKWSDGDFWPHNTTMFVKDFKGNNPKWVFHLFEATDLSGFNSGSVQPMLNRNYIAQVPVRVPPLNTQHAIAEVLGALDDKIAANTKIAETADLFLSAVFSQMTLGGKTVRLGDVAMVNPESCKPRAGGTLRYVDISSVGEGTFEFPDVSNWDDAPSRARRHIAFGDTLWSTVRPNRRSHALNLSGDPLLVGSTGLAVLRPQQVGFAYLYEATKTSIFTSYLENVAEGSAYPAVRASRFEDAPIAWSTEGQRNTFENAASRIRNVVHSLGDENLLLASTRDSLLPQLMSGHLSIKDAEALVEAAI